MENNFLVSQLLKNSYLSKLFQKIALRLNVLTVPDNDCVYNSKFFVTSQEYSILHYLTFGTKVLLYEILLHAINRKNLNSR